MPLIEAIDTNNASIIQNSEPQQGVHEAQTVQAQSEEARPRMRGDWNLFTSFISLNSGVTSVNLLKAIYYNDSTEDKKGFKALLVGLAGSMGTPLKEAIKNDFLSCLYYHKDFENLSARQKRNIDLFGYLMPHEPINYYMESCGIMRAVFQDTTKQHANQIAYGLSFQFFYKLGKGCAVIDFYLHMIEFIQACDETRGSKDRNIHIQEAFAGYAEAVKRINDCQKNSGEELGLDNLDLVILPPEIGQLTQLKALDISNNKLISLPAEFGQLTQLQMLDLDSNKLTTLPLIIGQLTQLQTLSLCSNQLTTLPPIIGQLTQLQTLSLCSNQLTTLPPIIGQLTQLKSLNIWKNKLISLPAESGQLTQLEKLYLCSNQLTTLPPIIGQLSQLKELDLSDNMLEALPPLIGQLTQLEILNLARNNLTSLPPEIRQLAALKSIMLSSNKLTTLPSEFGQLIQLKGLCLQKNLFTALPTEIDHLYQLTSCIVDRQVFGDLNSKRHQTPLPFELTKSKRLKSDIFYFTALEGGGGPQFKIGCLYYTHQKIGQNLVRAVHYLTIAANYGHAGAQAHLGYMYQNGIGVDKNPDEANHLFTRSAAQGNRDARCALYDYHTQRISELEKELEVTSKRASDAPESEAKRLRVDPDENSG